MRPKVSLIIPNYNYARPLVECLRAALAQTYPSVEVVLVDDSSTDDSPELAERMGVRVVRTPHNMGAPAARNLGARHADGEVLMFVDSDVALAPDAVANAVAVLESDPAIGAVCGTYDPDPLFADGLAEEYRSLQQYWYIAVDEGDITTSYTGIIAIRAELFAELGGFDPRMRDTDNAEFGYRLSQRRRIVLTSRVRGRHDHDDSFRVVFGKVFVRARKHIPLYLRRSDFSGGFSSGPKAWAAVITLAALASVAVPLLFGPVWTVVPVVAYGTALACDARMYRFVLGHRGPLFLGYFIVVHTLVNLTVASAAVVGGAQWLLSPRFRHMYDTPVGAAR